jgi:Rps23 Pro-64 3,4-dihydroxylase Tpa1-like proline 4-hydroxylase
MPAALATFPPALRDRVVVVDDFLPAELAEAMRREIDSHFAEPQTHTADRHQVWNYWFVPALYAYLRTAPERVIAKPSMDAFHERLRGWSINTMGLGAATLPYLSLYVSGCREALHNDALNGRFDYVYSLTRNERATIGGSTIVHREGDPSRSHMTSAGAGATFFDAVEPRFNRLIVFDDRLPHAVERVDGSMDPREGRFVLHGHLSESGPIAAGALSPEQVIPVVGQGVHGFAESTFIDGYHGALTLRLDIRPDGVVAGCRLLLDRVLSADPADRRWPRVLHELIGRFSALRFPAAAGPTVLVVPLAFGAHVRPPAAS